jgi:hypothetical protein
MNLKEIRTKFVELSGRFDLVVDTTDYVDNGANFFIQSGQRWLDRLENVSKSVGKVYKRIESGDWYAIFNDCRAVKKIYVADDESRWELVKKDLGWLMLEYEDAIDDIDEGNPQYYAPAILREVPQSLGAITMSKFVDENIQVQASHMLYNGIIFMPPADDTFIIEIQGLFYSEKLKVDSDINHWSINDPLILVFAALHELEESYRNTEGAKDWEAAVRSKVVGIGMDQVEEDIADVDHMEG